jgi:N-ethylmaleimide reductase
MSKTDLSPESLYQPFQLGHITLSNRMVMAPLTRSRAETGNVPGPMTVDYYAQRASIGLIIAEATQVSAQAQGYVSTPGVHSPEQIAGWKKVTDAVHQRGGRIFLQMWHTGRMSHTAFQPGEQAPVAPSAIAAKAQTYLPGKGFVPTSTPRALEISEIAGRSAPCHFGRLRRHRSARRPRLPAGRLPARWRQPPHRRLRRQHRKPRPLPD